MKNIFKKEEILNRLENLKEYGLVEFSALL